VFGIFKVQKILYFLFVNIIPEEKSNATKKEKECTMN
jgi:hypothetical protein